MFNWTCVHKALGWRQRDLLLSSQRRYQEAPHSLGVPYDLVNYPYVVVTDDTLDSDQVHALFIAYPIEHVLQVYSSKWQVWTTDGPTDITMADLRVRFGRSRRIDLNAALRRWSARNHAGCTDQDWLAKQLQIACDCLLAAGLPREEALTTLATLVLGLVAGEPLPARCWLQPDKVWQQLIDRAGAVQAGCFATRLPPPEINMWQLAGCLALGQWQSLAWDLLGPLLTAGLAAEVRRQHGVYFTPPELVDLCLDTSGVLGDGAENGDILDPCAGTGAFVVRLLARVRTTGSREALAQYLARLWAIEQDALSANLLTLNVAIQWAAACGEKPTPVPQWHLWQGDALQVYTEFGSASEQTRSSLSMTDPLYLWRQKCDFSCVLGNPPYVGESGNRALFAPYRTHPFWRHFSEAKMDFLQYFIVLGLSKLQDRPGGKLCFLTSAYWLTADGASRLRDLVLKQALVQQVLFLRSSQSLFGDAPGHHNVIFLLERCSITARRNVGQVRVREYQAVPGNALVKLTWEATYPEPQAALLGKPWQLFTTPAEQSVLAFLESYPPLSFGFAAKQGVVPGAQRVGKTELAALGAAWVAEHHIRLGEGIFILTSSELEQLALPPEEQRFLRPFIKCSAVKAYDICPDEPLWLIYLRHDTAQAADCPKLIEHLARFRPLLARKREFSAGRRDWFHLHWPREEAVFNGEKVLTAGRGRKPAFAWSATPLYAATDVYFIIANNQRGGGFPLSLLALEGTLNSGLAWFWFAHRTKDKGEQREFFSTALQAFPLPLPFGAMGEANWHEAHAYLEKLVRKLHMLGTSDGSVRDAIMQEVDNAVFDLYRLAPEHQVVIRNWLARERP